LFRGTQAPASHVPRENISSRKLAGNSCDTGVLAINLSQTDNRISLTRPRMGRGNLGGP
jgi:hypothetical protein